MHGHSRSYSYDDQGVGYSSNGAQGGPNYPYSQHVYTEQTNGPYYGSQIAGTETHGHSDPRYGRSTTPAPGLGQRYSRHVADPRYYQSSGMMPSSSHSGNTPSAPYISSHHYSSSHNTSTHNDRFIPTPSEMAGYQYGSIQDQHPSQSPSTYPTPGHHSRHPRNPSTSPILTSSRVSGTRSSQSSSSPTTERYPCEICGKTFSRSHDRKRHHETQHIPSPVLHRCRYCRKEFSRADSLKRHLDNGCDEMPSGSNK
ncbi:hypothetical protein D9757_008217 [Collybiopsis confluens]|uniref:C2H2-type domain-containing protein n=1 Tax=Collybiopsis confluens TaxID=2823264 RepID=A0A8H5HBH4_9AGAR|nr:hypothetical protein D9757_008217 [Collybiopsis confluens]